MLDVFLRHGFTSHLSAALTKSPSLGFQNIEVIGPGLRHFPPFSKVRSPVVGPALRLAHNMGQLMLNEVGPDLQNFIKDRSRHGPEAVAGDLLFRHLTDAVSSLNKISFQKPFSFISPPKYPLPFGFSFL